MPEAGQPVLFLSSNIQLELAASGIQIFRKTAANLEAVPECARGTPSLRTISPKVQTKKQQPAIRSGLLLYSPSWFGCCLRFPI